MTRYAIAIGFAVAAITLTSVLAPVLPHTMLPALGAVAITAVLGGAGPGLLVIVLVVTWFAATAGPALDRTTALRVTLFAIVGTFVVRANGPSRAGFRAAIALRREAARRIRARLESLRAITRAIDEGVYALDREGRITYVNAAAERMLGYRRSELLGLRLKDALRCNRIDGTCSGNSCRLLNVMTTGQPYRGADDTVTRKDGSCFPVRYSSAPIIRGGTVVGAAVAFEDITEERRAVERDRFLALATERLATSLDYEETLARVARLAVPYLGDCCMVVLVDEGGVPRRVVVGGLDEARAEEAREIMRPHPIDPEAEHGARRVFRTGAPELLAEEDGLGGHAGSTALAREELLRRIGLSAFISVPLRARGRVLGAMEFAIADPSRRFEPEDLAVASELARRCALAIDNAALYQQAHDAVQARDDTLAIVSHDLRNPLGAIRMAARGVARTAVPGDPAHKASESIERVCDRMSRLIGDLVDQASIDAGRLSMMRSPICPGDPAADAVEGIRPLAEELGVRIDLDLATDPPHVWGDRDRIQQILANLLSNAVKVTSRGGSVRLRSRRRPGCMVFSVSDHGPGIPLEHQPHIFDRYWRDANVPYRGTGLGLSIARGIVEAHGGRLWVVSRPGAGATLRFTIPVAPPEEAVAGATELSAAPRSVDAPVRAARG